MVGQHGDAAVIFRAGDAAADMLAGHQTALPVTRIAIGHVGGLAEHADLSGRLVPSQDPVIGNIAPQQIAAIGKIDRTFAPAGAVIELFDRGTEHPIAEKAGIENMDGGVRIPPVGDILAHRRSRSFCCLGLLSRSPADVATGLGR